MRKNVPERTCPKCGRTGLRQGYGKHVQACHGTDKNQETLTSEVHYNPRPKYKVKSPQLEKLKMVIRVQQELINGLTEM